MDKVLQFDFPLTLIQLMRWLQVMMRGKRGLMLMPVKIQMNDNYTGNATWLKCNSIRGPVLKR